MVKKEEKTKLQPEARLSKRTIVSYGVGHMLNDLCASMWFSYLLVFFHYVLGFDSSTSGIPLLIGQIADGLATPVIGILSDKGAGHWMCRYGHRKSWHLLGTLFVAISFPFIFSPYLPCLEESGATAKIAYYSIFIIVFQIGWAAVQVSHLSLAPDLTPNQDERTSLLTIRYSFTVVANIIVHMFTWLMFSKAREADAIGKDDEHKFQIVGYFAVALGCVFSLIFHFGVKEVHFLKSEANNGKILGQKLKKTTLLSSPRLYHIMAVYMMSQLYVNQSQVFLPLYLEEYLNIEAQRLPVLPLIMYLSSSMTSFLTKTLNTKYGRKTAYVIGSILAVFVCVLVYFGEGPCYTTYVIYSVTAAFGCASSILSVTSCGITADLIGQNTSNGAFVYGLMSFADKISNGTAVMIIQSLRHYYMASDYYRNMLIYMCGGSAALGMMFVVCLPRDLQFIKKENNNDNKNVKIVYCYENDVRETDP